MSEGCIFNSCRCEYQLSMLECHLRDLSIVKASKLQNGVIHLKIIIK